MIASIIKQQDSLLQRASDNESMEENPIFTTDDSPIAEILREDLEKEPIEFQHLCLEKLPPKKIAFKQKSLNSIKIKQKTPFELILTPLNYPQELKTIATPTQLNRLNPLFFSIEKTIALHLEKTDLSLIKSITYISPNSLLNGVEIKLEFFDTHPTSINIHLIGSPQANQIIQKDLETLQKLLKARFDTIEFPMIQSSLGSLFPTGFHQQKSKNQVSQKKVAEGKIRLKPIQSLL
jgi:hypothetical protein